MFAGDSIDLRRFVRIKKLPGGSRADCKYVEGVVITKNVQHKDMRMQITHPKILLLGFPVEFQQPQQNSLSIDAVCGRQHRCRGICHNAQTTTNDGQLARHRSAAQVLANEAEQMAGLVHRVASLEPDLVLAAKSVSRTAQNALRKAGLALALNFKPAVLHDIARATEGQIVANVGTAVLCWPSAAPWNVAGSSHRPPCHSDVHTFRQVAPASATGQLHAVSCHLL